MIRRGLVLPALLALAACGSADREREAEPVADLTAGAPLAQHMGQAPLAPAGPAGPAPGQAARPGGIATNAVIALGEAQGPLELQALDNVIEVDLGPTLGACAFDHAGRTLLIAGAEDDSAARGTGVVQLGGLQRALVGQRGGGPDAINAGPSMSDGEITVEVRRAPGEGDATGIESTRWRADLVVRRGVEETRTYQPGTWTCGV